MGSTETHQIMVRKLGSPVRAEGRGSSAEAFLRGRACRSSSFQNRWLSTCKSNQLCMFMCHLSISQPFNHNLEALNEATEMLSAACLLGPWDLSCQKSEKHIRAHDVRGISAEGPRKVRGNLKGNTGSLPALPMPLLPKSFLLSYGKPQ